MIKNCLRIFSPQKTSVIRSTFCAKGPLKRPTKRLSIWRQKRTMKWMAGHLGGRCIKKQIIQLINFHGIQINGSDIDTFGGLAS